MKTEFNKEHLLLSRQAAREGMVLLRNDNRALPLSKHESIALFGRNQIDTFKGGGGSADLWHIPVVSFADGLDEEGCVYQPLLEKYRKYSKANEDKTRNKIYPVYTYSLPEVPIVEEEIQAASEECRTAIVFIGRFAGENFDVKDIAGEYRITEAEENLLKSVSKIFDKCILVLNLPGLFDISFLNNYKIDAILHTFMPGMEAGHALADIIYGDATPCGKLADSFAETVSDYPTNNEFGTKHIVYSEGIYMGYRYFETFGKETVFPFGFGLSYTTFCHEVKEILTDGTDVSLTISIKNTGGFNGREIIQCYLSCPEIKLEQPSLVLCAFAKTQSLMPDEEETVSLHFSLKDFSSYCEDLASYILEEGNYTVYVGTNIKDVYPICTLRLPSTVICKKVKNRLSASENITLLKKDIKKSEKTSKRVFTIAPKDCITEASPEESIPTELIKTKNCTFYDVKAGLCTPEELVACLDDEELSLLVTADGEIKRTEAGIIPNCDLICGEGTHTHPIKKCGIPSSVMQDGPAGLRGALFENPVPPDEFINARDCVSYPCSTLIACSWDTELARCIGEAIAYDLDRYGFNGWCAPSINLHRNPLCGRNFEYFSEDPYLSAQMAIAEIRGIQEKRDGSPSGLYAVLKHLVCNESENERLFSDSILTERTARELYLRAFEYVVKTAPPLSIMSAYNKVNGKYASANKDLLEGICRTEWGFDGLIMTDWCVKADVIDCLLSGIDTDMPGRYITPDTWKKSDRAILQKRAVSLIKHLTKTKHHHI